MVKLAFMVFMQDSFWLDFVQGTLKRFMSAASL